MNPNRNRTDLFSGTDAKNPTDFNNYDLSHTVRMTAKAGEILPVSHRTLMAGDHVKIRLGSFTRTSPSLSRPMTRIREFVDAFFVPYRQLWRNAPQSFTFNTQNPISATTYNSDYQGSNNPFSWDYSQYVSTIRGESNSILRNLNLKKNALGFNRGKQSVKLLNYLEYPYIASDKYGEVIGSSSFHIGPYVQQRLSIAPLLAYQKIYNDYFRNTQWENSRPSCFNIDYSDGSYNVPVESVDPSFYDNSTPFDLRYCCYPKDCLFGILPATQHGNVSTVSNLPQNLGTKGVPIRAFSGRPNASMTDTLFGPYNDTVHSVSEPSGTIGNNIAQSSGLKANTSAGQNWLGVLSSDIQSQLLGAFSILDLRFAQADQRFKEILGSGKLDYANIVSKIFGYSPQIGFTDTVIYLGGTPQDIEFNETTNTNLTDGQEPVINSNGVSKSFDNDFIDFVAPDFGILMIVYHAIPDIEYSINGIHPDITKVTVDDYANPVFDRIGFQEMPLSAWYAPLNAKSTYKPKPNIGYTYRYWDYKTSRDIIKGDLKESRKQWVSPIDSKFFESFIKPDGTIQPNSSFFLVDPAVLDPIFYLKSNDEISTDQLLPSITIEAYASRNLNRFGLPNT